MEYTGVDRRRTDRRAASRDEWERWREGVNNRLHTNERDVSEIKSVLLPRIEKIDAMHEVFVAAQGGFTVLTWIGKGAKPVLWIVAAIGGVLGVKHFPWP